MFKSTNMYFNFLKLVFYGFNNIFKYTLLISKNSSMHESMHQAVENIINTLQTRTITLTTEFFFLVNVNLSQTNFDLTGN